MVWNSIGFQFIPLSCFRMIRNTLNHCLKFPLHSIFCHIYYGKISEKLFNTLNKVKLLVSKTSDSCFQGFDFFQMLLACYKYYKYLINVLSLKENKESSQVGWISKVSIACISWGSCKQTRPIYSSRRHRISTRLHMQQHIKLLSSLIISFYILTTKFLCYIFSKGHAMACHGGCHNLDIFVKCESFYAVLISPVFSKMADGGDFCSSHL